MPCEIRPIAANTPQATKGRRGVAAESGDKPKAEATNVPYKRENNNLINQIPMRLLLICVFAIIGIFGVQACQSDGTEDKPNSEMTTLPTVDDLISEDEKELEDSERFVRSLPKTKPNPIVLNVPTDIQKNIFIKPVEYLDKLVDYLSTNAKNDKEKAILFHDWIAQNIAYDVRSYFSDVIPNQSYMNVLKSKKAVCEGNAKLFKEMCDRANIECLIVGGYSRGYGYKLFGDIEEEMESNHAWNAVRFDDNDDDNDDWRLLDITWDAGYIKNKKYIRDYSTAYLFLAPEKFINTHFPDNVEYQFLENTISKSEFRKMPKLSGGFYSYGLSLPKDIQSYTEADGQYTINIKTPDNVDMSAVLEDLKGKRYDNCTFVQRVGNTSQISVSFPRSGNWILVLFARFEDKKDYRKNYTGVGELGFKSTAPSQAFFPEILDVFVSNDVVLYSPINSPLKIGETYLFKAKIPNMKVAQLQIGDEMIKLDAEDDFTFSKEIKIPQGDKATLFVGQSQVGQFSGVLKWQIKGKSNTIGMVY